MNTELQSIVLSAKTIKIIINCNYSILRRLHFLAVGIGRNAVGLCAPVHEDPAVTGEVVCQLDRFPLLNDLLQLFMYAIILQEVILYCSFVVQVTA